ncbi:hypothetical protein EV359DRAFT_68683 [Lentinula novae-zelandiae]|nr:hypothetical protein EV359DRAFT_68683 [Lentinula novae-zelandiae]
MVIEQAQLDYTLLLDSQAGYLLAEGPNPINISMETAPSENERVGVTGHDNAKTHPRPSTFTSLSLETANGPSVDESECFLASNQISSDESVRDPRLRLRSSSNQHGKSSLLLTEHHYKIVDSTHNRVQLLNLVGMRPQLTADHSFRHSIQLLTVDHSRQTDLGVRTISYFCNRRTYYRNLCYPNDHTPMKNRNGKFSYRGAPGPSRVKYCLQSYNFTTCFVIPPSLPSFTQVSGLSEKDAPGSAKPLFV